MTKSKTIKKSSQDTETTLPFTMNAAKIMKDEVGCSHIYGRRDGGFV